MHQNGQEAAPQPIKNLARADKGEEAVKEGFLWQSDGRADLPYMRPSLDQPAARLVAAHQPCRQGRANFDEGGTLDQNRGRLARCR